MIFRRRLPLLITALLTAACQPGSVPAPTVEPAGTETLSRLQRTCPRCDIVLVTFDTVRADLLACLGSPVDVAPRTCDLGRRGVLFERAISPASWTVPALTSMMTGRISSNQVRTPTDALRLVSSYAGYPTLARRLSQRGYTTALFSDHGGMQANALRWMPALDGLTTIEDFGAGVRERRSEEVVRRGIAWLTETARTERPRFLWLHLFDPHHDYLPKASDETRFGYDATRCGDIVNGFPLADARRRIGIAREDADDLRCLRELHLAEVGATDALLGRIATAPGLVSRKTVLVVSADHGEEFLEHDDLGHGQSVHDELIHVPLVLAGPGLPAGLRVREAVSTAFLPDLLLAVVGLAPWVEPPPVVSRTLRVPPTGTDDFAWVEADTKCIFPRGSQIPICYDLRADPGERHPLPTAGRTEAIAARFAAWRSRHELDLTGSAPVPKVDASALAETLRNLGYLE